MHISKIYRNEAAIDVSSPVVVYIGESDGGSDRSITLKGSTIFDKLLALHDAHTYATIGPKEGTPAWDALDEDDRSYFQRLQASAKQIRTFKAMGEFLNELCRDSESFLFAIRQGDEALWVNPDIVEELDANPWRGRDGRWLYSL